MMDFIRRVYWRIFPMHRDYVRRELQRSQTVLDLGCGRGFGLQYIRVPYLVGVEIHKPYLDECKRRGFYSELILADIRKIEFKEHSFDTVLAQEVIEHMAKEEGMELISKMERWARKKVVITTPSGFIDSFQFAQRYAPQSWEGLPPSQIHKCGWSTKEFEELGFKVYGVGGWKLLRCNPTQLKFKASRFWQVVSDLTQKLTYYRPDQAFTLFCVKSVNGET